jgi:hypothetical protein
MNTTEFITQPFETQGHDLSGHASLNFHDRENFNTFASKIAGYNPDRFDPVALKIFVEKNEVIVTLYALDKSAQEQSTVFPEDKLPVRKFKLVMNWTKFLSHIRQFDMIVSDGSFDLKDMVIINK